MGEKERERERERERDVGQDGCSSSTESQKSLCDLLYNQKKKKKKNKMADYNTELSVTL